MPFHSLTLPNGLQIIGETSPSARSAAVGFFVRTGSRDEEPEVAGVSHFLEHMMFKGTPRRSALEVNLDFDRIGAKYNAYTSEEFTVYHAAVLPEYLPPVIDILTDILRPSLRQEDFDTEKQVILEEIDMYDDQPGSAAMESARKIYYAEHPLGNSVLGSKESVRSLTREQIAGYFTKRYGASNILVAIAGNFAWEPFVAMVAKASASWEPGECGRTQRQEWPGTGGLHVRTREKVLQEYLLAMAGGPPANSMLRYSADTIALAVGDSYGSRLYWALVDPGLADSADLGYYEYEGNGLVCASFTAEPDQTPENLAILEGILGEVQEKSITADELKQAKSKIASRVVRGSERPMGRMQAIASAWSFNNEYRDVDTDMARYDAVTLTEIRSYLDQYPINRMTTVAFGPLSELNDVTGEAV